MDSPVTCRIDVSPCVCLLTTLCLLARFFLAVGFVRLDERLVEVNARGPGALVLRGLAGCAVARYVPPFAGEVGVELGAQADVGGGVEVGLKGTVVLVSCGD